ncbi:hypothetical protein [Mycobacterium camsae]|uniref:hypothetical protein n=1 Tax=Mycobacterium gordonae TaxID=1778 RepID=UPI00197F3028|nr:hypothetical protein [Mycobacterium gordonae]
MTSTTIKAVGIYCAFAATAIALTATLGLGSDPQQATSMNDTTTAPTTTLTPLTTLAPPSTLDAPPALSAPPAPPLP